MLLSIFVPEQNQTEESQTEKQKMLKYLLYPFDEKANQVLLSIFVPEQNQTEESQTEN